MLKFKRNAAGQYRTEFTRDTIGYMIERDEYHGWNLYTKSSPAGMVYDVHVVNCDTLRDCKNIASAMFAVSVAFPEYDTEYTGVFREYIAVAFASAEATGESLDDAVAHVLRLVAEDVEYREAERAAEETPEETPAAMTCADLDALDFAARFRVRDGFNDGVNLLETVYTETREATPAETVAEFVRRVGYADAVALLATLVNRYAWDGRISRRVAEWASRTPSAWDEAAAVRMGVYSNRIHCAHLDQIAAAMMAYTPEEPTAEEIPATTTATEAEKESETMTATEAEKESETMTATETRHRAPADLDAVRELALYAENDRRLYDRHAVPIIKNLARKMKRGEYDPARAVKAWRVMADAAAVQYVRDFCALGERYFDIFNAATREEAARELSEGYLYLVEETAAGEGV